jgi:MFS family permease
MQPVNTQASPQPQPQVALRGRVAPLPKPLIAAMLLQFAATGAVLPFVTLLLRDRGLSYERISQVFLAASATMLVFPFLWGMVADRYLALNRLFIVVNLCGAAALAGMSVAGGFTGLLLAFAAYTACMNPTFALISALSFHHLPDPREQFGRLRAWGSVGWIIPFLPIALWTAHQHQAGLNVILYLGMGLCVGMAGLSLWLPHTPPRARGTTNTGSTPPLYLPAVRRLLNNANYLVVLAAMFLVSGSFALTMYYVQPYLETVGVPRPWIGPVQAIGVAAEVILFQFQPAALRRLNYAATIALGCLALAVRHLLFSWVNVAWVLCASYALTGVVVVFFHMGVSVLVNALAEPEVRATAQTLLGFCSLGLGPMFANWAAGFLTARWHDDLHPVFLLGAGMAALAVLLIAVRARQLNAVKHPEP